MKAASHGVQTSPLWPAPHVSLAMREISGQCSCTWVVTEYDKAGGSRSSLKYRDALCPALRFHRSLAGGSPLGSYRDGKWVDDPEDPKRRNLVGATYEGPDQARYDRCKALDDAVESGAFDDVLLEAFGDHADITVKRDGITVEFYSHD